MSTDTVNKQLYGFDGRGINDYGAEYKPRIATLTEHGHAINAGPLLAAAPDLLKALSACLAALEGFLDYDYDKKPVNGATTSEEMAAVLARAVLARAKGQA